jgi:heme A synthase
VKRLAGYPHWFYTGLMTGIAGLFCTGIALLPSMLAMRLDIEMSWRVAGDMRLIVAAVHCAAGFLLFGMVGALLAIHVRIGWRRRLNRISGMALLVLLILLLVSTLGIYYLGDELWSRVSSVTHTSAGLLIALAVVWHSIKGRRLRRDSIAGRVPTG